MKVERYGVVLRRIQKEDIELVRKWRNSDKIRKNMFFQDYITPEMQEKWFESVNNYKHSYYIIIYENKKIGLINIKNSSDNEDYIESGLFIADKRYENSYISVIASIILIESGLYILPERKSYARIKKSNISAIKYNESLGFFIVEENDDYVLMALTKKSYEKKTTKLRKAIRNLFGNVPLKFYITPDDYENGVADWYMPFIESIPDEMIKEKDFSGDVKYIIFDEKFV